MTTPGPSGCTKMRPCNFIAHRWVDTLSPCTPRLAMQFKRFYIDGLLRVRSMRVAPGSNADRQQFPLQLGRFGAGQTSQRLPTETQLRIGLGLGAGCQPSCDQAGITLAKGKCEKKHRIHLIEPFLFPRTSLSIYLTIPR